MDGPKPLRIGLTGGIGSGKSTVAALLVARGARLVDTDQIARELTQPGGAALAQVVAAFGPEFIAADGGLDRARMRNLAFADPLARVRLESILHPLIGREAEARAGAPDAVEAVVFDIPLLVESSHWSARLDRVWVVDCHEDTQIERVSRRPGWTLSVARAVIRQQAARARRRAAADAVIHNDGVTLDALGAEIAALWDQTLATPSARTA